MQNKAFGLLGLAQKGGNIAVGDEPVATVAQAGKARLIILAADAADHAQRRAMHYASLHSTPVVQVDGDKAALGATFGKASVAMAALTDIQLAKSFLLALDQPERYAAQLEAVTQKAEAIAKRKREKPRRTSQRGTR